MCWKLVSAARELSVQAASAAAVADRQQAVSGALTESTQGLVDGLGLFEAVSLRKAFAQALTASQVDQIQHPCNHGCAPIVRL